MALRSSAVVVERSCCSVAPAARSLSTVSFARAMSIPASRRKGASPASHSSPPTRACNGPASVCVRRLRRATEGLIPVANVLTAPERA